MTNFTNVNTRAILVGLHLSTWSARKFDKKATDTVNADSNAAPDAGRYNKHLLAGAASHKAVIEASQKARILHYRETLPWADEGQRLLPTSNYFQYMEKLRHVKSEFDSAVAAFIADYPSLQQQAKVKLGSLYNETDFPAVKDIVSRFAWELTVLPVPAQGDLRLDLPGEQIDAIEQAVASRVEQATKDAMKDAWSRLHDAVSRIHKAAGENGVVRSTLIENARLVVDVLARLNIAQDADLDAFRVRVDQELTGIAVEDLRNDDLLRADTERRAADILAAMGAFYAPVAA